MQDGASEASFRRIGRKGPIEQITRPIAAETPMAIEIDGLGYAVLMATPADLADLAAGFALAERLIDGPDDLIEVAPFARADGIILRLTLAPRCAGRVASRVRHRATDSSCGLCGIENLEQALRPLPPVTASSRADDAALFRALDELEAAQPLGALTRAVHGAALCGADGAIRLVREDVGRHNAFDKLIGAMTRGEVGWEGGFALLTSRCSYELVEKAALAGCPLLATVSAPTGLALAAARQAGLALRVLARRDAVLVPV